MRTAHTSPAGSVALLLAVALAAAAPLGAIEFRTGDRVTVEAGEVVTDDLYAAAAIVVIDGQVLGDVMAAGRDIVVNGSVEGDLNAAGQTVLINGSVGDDARIAGFALQLAPAATVGDDLLSAGFSLETLAGSAIAGSLVATGFQALLGGRIGEAMTGSLAGLDLRGEVDGDVRVTVDGGGRPFYIQFFDSSVSVPSVASGLTVGETARIGGRLSYLGGREADVAPGALIEGGVERRAPEEAPETTAEPAAEAEAAPAAGRGRALRLVRRLAVLLLVGLLLVGLAPRRMNSLAEALVQRPLPSLGWGALTLLAFPVAGGGLVILAILLAVAAGMLSLPQLVLLIVLLALLGAAALWLGLWVLVAFAAPVIVALAVGRVLLGRLAPGSAGGRFLPLLLGLVPLGIVLAIPVFGFLIRLVVALLGLGALARTLLAARRRSTPAPA